MQNQGYDDACVDSMAPQFTHENMTTATGIGYDEYYREGADEYYNEEAIDS